MADTNSPVDQAGMSGTKCSTMGNCAGTCILIGFWWGCRCVYLSERDSMCVGGGGGLFGFVGVGCVGVMG